MKTSNKILLFIGLALLVSPFINAFNLRQKLANKEYTLLNERNERKFERVSLTPTDSIHIIGDNNLTVEITRSDTAMIMMEKNSHVDIYEEHNVLTIQYSREDDTDSPEPRLVTIKTPSVKAISLQGKFNDKNVNNKYENATTRYYPPLKVTVRNFKTDQLNINGINGNGIINLDNIQSKKLSLNIGEQLYFEIDRKSHIDSMRVQAAKKTNVTFNGTHVNSLKTKIDTTTALTIIGGKVADAIPY